MKSLIYFSFTMASILLIEAIIPGDASMKISQKTKKRCEPTAIIISFKGNVNLKTDESDKQKISKDQSLCGSDQIKIGNGGSVVIKCTSDQQKHSFTEKLSLAVNNICGNYLVGPGDRGDKDLVTAVDDKPNIITPRGNILDGQNIHIRWDNIKGVKSYSLSIQDDGNQEVLPKQNQNTDKNDYYLKNLPSPLISGITHKLTVTTDKYIEASAKFEIIRIENKDDNDVIKMPINSYEEVIKKVLIYKKYQLFSEAIELLEKQDNKSYDIYKHLAVCYEAIGRIDKAKEVYEEALKRKNTPEEELFLNNQLKELQKLIDKNNKGS